MSSAADRRNSADSDEEEEIILTRRKKPLICVENEKRGGSSSRNYRASALQELQQMRQGGKTNKYTMDESSADVYEMVDEETYANMVRQRQDDDWIVGDGGDDGGYVEDGREIFDEEYNGQELGRTNKKKNDKQKEKVKCATTKKEASRQSAGSGITGFFSSVGGSAGLAKTKKAKNEATVGRENDDLLSACLGQALGNNWIDTFSSSKQRVVAEVDDSKASSAVASVSNRSTNMDDQLGSLAGVAKRPPTSPLKECSRTSTLKTSRFYSPIKHNGMKNLSAKDSCHTTEDRVAAVAIQSEEDGRIDDFQVENEISEGASESSNKVDAGGSISVASDGAVASEQNFNLPGASVDKSALSGTWVESTSMSIGEDDKMNARNAQPTTVKQKTPPLFEDGSDRELKLYLLDVYEDVFRQPGTVFMFGRVPLSDKGSTSCAVVVRNVEKVLYFLPRKTRLINGVDTGESVTMVDVYEEVNKLFKNYKEIRIKQTLKKYCFGVGGVPAESDYMEVRYRPHCGPSHQPQGDVCIPEEGGETFARVFGLQSTPLESFLLDRKLRGPGWISLTDTVVVSEAKSSWCQYEVHVDSPKCVNKVESAEAPKSTLHFCAAAVKLATVPSADRNQRVIIGACVTVDKRFSIDGAHALSEKALEHIVVLTKHQSVVLPFDFKDRLKKCQPADGEARVEANEKALLTFLLAKLQRLDPDFILGHDIIDDALQTLLQRLAHLKVPQWSRIGRLRRHYAMPKFSHTKSAHVELCAGRVMVDSRIAAGELVRAKSYDMTTLVEQLLSVRRVDFLPDAMLAAYGSSKTLFELMDWMLTDTRLIFRLIIELNALPLFIQITQICGGVLSRTMMGGRSERNEYLLMHAFYDAGYICPDKFGGKKSRQKVFNIPSVVCTLQHKAEGGSTEDTGDGKKKCSYTGGLVLDPLKGLYDTYVLLLDFNSLYPSIIQEYNICFTTVDLPSNEHSKKLAEEQLDKDSFVPNLPPVGLAEGILPVEIRKLVESRREVKKLLKRPNISKELAKQYDIRQLALKLTANSMYGCLGFVNSRFYAKPLAALITSKGREILMHTKELVDRLGLSVIYGDTDSIMINTNSVQIDEVVALGNKVKAEVNKLYRLLELDIDGVYKRLLLLKKKKYAGLAVERATGGNGEQFRQELKGLDIVRRDWSELAKRAGRYVIDELLNVKKEREEAITAVDAYLVDLAGQMRAGTVENELHIITKQLTRSLDLYADKNSQPHVAVALRMNSTGQFTFKQGDIVPYVICEDGTSNSANQRSYHPLELKSQAEKLKIDTNYYLSQQLHPVVSRLLEPIEGVDAARIAASLGLDSTPFLRRIAGNSDEPDAADDWNDGPAADEPDVSACSPFVFPCCNPDCATTLTVESPFVGEGDEIEFSLAKCSSCGAAPHRLAQVLINVLKQSLRSMIKEAFQASYVCDDGVCAFRTRQAPARMIKGSGRLLCPYCRLGPTWTKPLVQYSDRRLYSQMEYLSRMFNVDKHMDARTELERNKLKNCPESSSLLSCYRELKKTVDAFHSKNAYGAVDFKTICQKLRIL